MAPSGSQRILVHNAFVGGDAEVRVSHPDEARRAAALDAVLAIVERDQYRPPPSRGNTADRGRRDEF